MTELTEVTNLTPKDVFAEGKAENIIQTIEKEARAFVPDLSTDKGRKAIASMAHKVSTSKTFLDGMGKDLVAARKASIKAVDDTRKIIRDRFDALRDEVRKPLTDWQAEQKAAEEAAAALAKLQADHGEAIAMNEHFDTKRKLEALEREARLREQEEHNREVAKRQEFEDGARAVESTFRQETVDEVDHMVELRSEGLAAAVAETAQHMTAEFDPVTQAMALANKLELEGGTIEVIREEVVAANPPHKAGIQGAEASLMIEDEVAAKEHQGNVNRIALNAMVDQGIDAATAKKVIIMIAKNLIPDVYMNY